MCAQHWSHINVLIDFKWSPLDYFWDSTSYVGDLFIVIHLSESYNWQVRNATLPCFS